MRISGFAFPMVPTPLTLMVVPDSPGWPVGFVTVTPGSSPCSPELTLEIGRVEISSLSIIDTEPVRFTFFWVP